MFQVFQSGNPRADEIVLSNMAIAFDRMFYDVEVIFNYYSIIMFLQLKKNVHLQSADFFFLDKSDIGYKLSVFTNPLYEILQYLFRTLLSSNHFTKHCENLLTTTCLVKIISVLQLITGEVTTSMCFFPHLVLLTNLDLVFNQPPEIEDFTRFMFFYTLISVICHSSILICMWLLNICCFMKYMWSLSMINKDA